ncbi:MAG: MCE family protein, partial [Candidatus Obscuribacter sp.]|nr:MCE family protein [Candidatus Obscuribacter sp.]
MTAQNDTIPSSEQRPLDNSVRLLTDGSIGVFTTVAIILLLWGLCWLKSYSSLRPPQHIKLIFHEIAGLNDNAAVYVDGVRVGMVEQIEWLMDRRVLVRLRIH